MVKLFETEIYDIVGPQGHNQDIYSYYSRSSRKDIAAIRSQLEKWFEAYPAAEKNDLINNFKNDFEAAFFELFLYTLFYRLGYTITIHPTIPNSNKKPDFLVSGFGEEFYLEAKVSFYESQEEKSTAKMLGSLYAILDKAAIPDFFLYLKTIEVKGKQQPRSNVILHAIEETINRYNVEELFQQMNSGAITKPPLHVYEDDRIYIEFGPIPKTVDGRGKKEHRVIGLYGGKAKVLNNVESLRKALKIKAGRYGSLDKPYVIAVNAIDMMGLDKDDVMDCLMGTTCIVPQEIEDTGSIQEFRQHDGFFTGRNDQGQNTRVSAAFLTKINPGNWKGSEYWIIENQKAKYPVRLRKSGLTVRFIEDGIIYRSNGKDFGEIIE